MAPVGGKRVRGGPLNEASVNQLPVAKKKKYKNRFKQEWLKTFHLFLKVVKLTSLLNTVSVK